MPEMAGDRVGCAKECFLLGFAPLQGDSSTGSKGTLVPFQGLPFTQRCYAGSRTGSLRPGQMVRGLHCPLGESLGTREQRGRSRGGRDPLLVPSAWDTTGLRPVVSPCPAGEADGVEAQVLLDCKRGSN